MEIVFDTNILVDCLRNKKEAIELLTRVAKREIKGYISGITEAELLSGGECKNKRKKETIKNLVGLFEKIVPNNEITQTAGEFRRKYNLSLLDCIIGATAFIQRCKLWTKNIEHFTKIKEIKSEDPY